MGIPGVGDGSDSSCIQASIVDPEQFAVIFERHAGAVHRYLARRSDFSAVDDLLAEVFLIAFRTRRGYDCAYADAAPWLFGIATNVVRHHRRSEGRRLAMVSRFIKSESQDQAGNDPADHVVARLDFEEQAERMKLAMSRLDDKYADALTLLTGPELSYEEISRALGIPIGTVRSRLSRGRAQLRELLELDGQYQDDKPPATLRLIEENPQ